MLIIYVSSCLFAQSCRLSSGVGSILIDYIVQASFLLPVTVSIS